MSERAEQKIPRRVRVDQWTPAEHAIDAAVLAVEKAGADVRLTDAVTLLYEARQAVADYVDQQARRRLVRVTDGLEWPSLPPVRAQEPTDRSRCAGCGETTGDISGVCETCWMIGPPKKAALPPVPETPGDGPGANRPCRFDCDECRVRGVVVDEDGCCKGCGYDARPVSSPLRETPAPDLARVRALPDRWEGFMRDANEQGDASKAFAYAVAVLELRQALSAALEGAATKHVNTKE